MGWGNIKGGRDIIDDSLLILFRRVVFFFFCYKIKEIFKIKIWRRDAREDDWGGFEPRTFYGGLAEW